MQQNENGVNPIKIHMCVCEIFRTEQNEIDE